MRKTCIWALAGVLGLGVAWACSDEMTGPGTDAELAANLAVTPVRLVAAGDIAGCNAGYKDELTARLVDSLGGPVLLLGDNAYPDGSAADYKCYHATWGRFKSRTYPSPGNHEYHMPNASGYFNYFGSRAGPAGRGYYAFSLGGWRVYSLNSEVNITTQTAWLKADLAAHPAFCVLAFWHKPRFTSGKHPGSSSVKPLYQALYNAKAEVVLTGHNHHYERFAPQDANGTATSRGIRQFVVGTGGSGQYPFYDYKAPNSEVRIIKLGVLRLSLYPDRYWWQFITVTGQVLDKGGRTCR